MLILVTGNAGSGKSTLAKRIAEQEGLEYFSLDSIVWQERWRIRRYSSICHAEYATTVQPSAMRGIYFRRTQSYPHIVQRY